MNFNLVVCTSLLVMSNMALAEEKQNKQLPRLTTMDVINLMIKEGMLTNQRAEDLLQEIASSKTDAADQVKDETMLDTKTVRVPYVPEFIKNNIRDQVRLGLREEVVEDVIGQARHERWGVPGVLPEWINRIRFKGDFRLRYQSDLFAETNVNSIGSYYNFQYINEQRNIGTDNEYFHNLTEDRHRLRARLRLAMDAKVTQGINVGMRLATGKYDDPVSTNQTLGNTSQPYRVILDRAFVKAKTEYDELTFWGGRMPNPWIGTDLVWDKDLNFDGLAFNYRPLQSDDIDNDERIFDTSITLGAFPIEDVALSSSDKWLLGLQFGFNWSFMNQDTFDVAIAYYDYRNIEGVRNISGSDIQDFTAPDFIQQGNTLYEISDPLDADVLFGLAADYNLVDLTIKYQLARFAPVNLTITADYVKNIGYDKNDLLARTGGSHIAIYGNVLGEPKVDGYMLKLDIGWPNLLQRNNWQASIAYKHLERDAVLDAFTDSDFRTGGTDAEGWIIQGKYAVEDNVWLSLKMISADEIDGTPYGVDTIQLDLNTVF